MSIGNIKSPEPQLPLYLVYPVLFFGLKIKRVLYQNMSLLCWVVQEYMLFSTQKTEKINNINAWLLFIINLIPLYVLNLMLNVLADIIIKPVAA